MESAVRIAKLEMENNVQYLEMRSRTEMEAMTQKLESMEKEFKLKLELLEQKIESLK